MYTYIDVRVGYDVEGKNIVPLGEKRNDIRVWRQAAAAAEKN